MPDIGRSTIRFAPRLDGGAGRPLAVPVFLRDPHSEVDRVAERLAVDVSFDGGATWEPAPVVGNAVVVIHYPKGNGTVSLRGTATDRHGGTVERTVVNAYQTGRGR